MHFIKHIISFHLTQNWSQSVQNWIIYELSKKKSRVPLFLKVLHATCVFVCEAHFDTNCWKNNLIHFPEKSRFFCLIMPTNFYLVVTYLITLSLWLWASKVFSEITFFLLFLFIFVIYATLQSSWLRTKRTKQGENRAKKWVSCHFQLSLKVDRSSFEFCLKVDNKAKFWCQIKVPLDSRQTARNKVKMGPKLSFVSFPT